MTSSTLYFTPLASLRPKKVIALKDIRGVKKTGVMGGLQIRWVSPGASAESTRQRSKSVSSLALTEDVAEELFRWVGGRDELFGRLVAWGDRKWLNV